MEEINKPNALEIYLSQILEVFSNELEERFTSPDNNTDISSTDIEMVRKGEKIPENSEKYALLVRVAQDFKLTPDEVDALVERVFE